MSRVTVSDIKASDITLGILAGGRGMRLGQRDKAWLKRDGLSQVERWARRFPGQVSAVLVSANRDPERFQALDLGVVADRYPGIGPVAGLDALSAACRMPWLFTVPVDMVDAPDDLLRIMIARTSAVGAYARDDDGPQPLVALWRVADLRTALDATLPSKVWAIHELQRTLGLACVRLDGTRFGNLNTPQDLEAAGVVDDRS